MEAQAGQETDRHLQEERLRTEYSFEDGESLTERMDAAREQIQRWWSFAAALTVALVSLVVCLVLGGSLALPVIPLLVYDFCLLMKTVQHLRSKPSAEMTRMYVKLITENIAGIFFKMLLCVYVIYSHFQLWIAVSPLIVDVVFQLTYRGRFHMDCSAFSEMVGTT